MCLCVPRNGRGGSGGGAPQKINFMLYHGCLLPPPSSALRAGGRGLYDISIYLHRGIMVPQVLSGLDKRIFTFLGTERTRPTNLCETYHPVEGLK